jgi:hypothetical protein
MSRPKVIASQIEIYGQWNGVYSSEMRGVCCPLEQSVMNLRTILKTTNGKGILKWYGDKAESAMYKYGWKPCTFYLVASVTDQDTLQKVKIIKVES